MPFANVWTVWIAGLGAVLAMARLCEEYAGPLYRERATALVAGDIRWVKALANVMERLFFWLYTINEQPAVLKAIVISTVVSTYLVRSSVQSFIIEVHEGDWSDVSAFRLALLCLLTGVLAGVATYFWNFRTRAVVRRIKRDRLTAKSRLPLWHACATIGIVVILFAMEYAISTSGFYASSGVRIFVQHVDQFLEPVPRFTDRRYGQATNLMSDAAGTTLFLSIVWPYLAVCANSLRTHSKDLYGSVSWLSRFVVSEKPFITIGFILVVLFTGIYWYVVLLGSLSR